MMLQQQIRTPRFCHTISNPDDDLNIPIDFYNLYSCQLKANYVVIKGSEGMDWLISMHKTEEGTLKLGPGWKMFTVSHGIQRGEVIVFWLVGTSELCTEIFGSDGCLRHSTVPMYKERVPDFDHGQNIKACKMLQSKEEAANMMTMNHKTDYPNFRVVLQHTHVQPKCLLRINRKFATKYLKYGSLTLLDSQDSRWQVNIIKPWRMYWRSFVLDHKLEVGDVCVFEAINQQDTLRVHLFRLKDFPTLTQNIKACNQATEAAEMDIMVARNDKMRDVSPKKQQDW